ncbi:MAG: GDSL-type esterase/lipase family protein [Bacilli bacterium]|jgi:lysophospholipase L1-like esterase
MLKRFALFVLLVGFIIPAFCFAQKTTDEKWHNWIARFEEADKNQPVGPNPIVCVGSSSMVCWKHMARDLAPLPVINRGFGGSTLPEAFYYMDELIVKYNPVVVMVYEGDNDIFSVEPSYFRMLFEAFEKQLHKKLPDTQIIFLSIKPSISRLHIWEKSQQANKLIEEYTKTKNYLTYIDITETLFGDDGKLDPDLFLEEKYEDKLHLNEQGYLKWTPVIKPVLEREYKKAMELRNAKAIHNNCCDKK